MPVSQKYIASSGCPSAPVTSETTGSSAPDVPARNIAMAGTMVRKMPANSLPTSRIGNQEKPLASRLARSVTTQDRYAMASRARSRQRFCSSTVTWKTSKETPGRHTPDISTAATTPASSRKLALPVTPRLSPSPWSSSDGAPVSRR